MENNSCLFIGKNGLFKVYCTFYVMCINTVANINQGDVKVVEKVSATSDGTLVFIIESNYYYYYHFALLHF